MKPLQVIVSRTRNSTWKKRQISGASSSNTSDDNISLDSVDSNSAEVNSDCPISNDSYQKRQTKMNVMEQKNDTENKIVNTVDKFEIVTSVTDIRNILEGVSRLQDTLDVIETRLTNIEKKLNCEVPQDSLDGLAELPLKTLHDLQEFEEKLIDDDYRKKLFQVLRLVGGSNEKSCINKVLEKVFTNFLAMFCSWTGKKGNFRLKDLKIMEVVMSAVRANYSDISEDTFEKNTMAWFRFAKLRFTRNKP